MSKLNRPLLGLIISAAFASSAQAASFRLEEAAAKAVQTNPDVVNKWNQFKAAGEERNVSWGRYLPTLDVMYGIGHESKISPLYTPYARRKYDFQTARVTLRQNLFEGFATENDTKRLEHATLVRFYEMLDLSENAAFEATKAYIDVWRYRQLVSYAEENYALHRVIFEKIKVRAQKGVGRQVDLETAAGRLALAESNLLTETSNLHDVTARFQRVVGIVPPADMDAPPAALLAAEFPKNRSEAITRSFEKSPQLKAAFQNILSAMRNVEVQKAPYYPRVDAYVERGHDIGVGGYAPKFGQPSDETDYTTYGLTVSWNLFNGLRDISRERKAAHEKNSAKDVREKVCREVRQNSAMAFNEQARLTEQIQYLDQHQLSTDKARESFRRQFDIGQRTLLDVLDTENEYYTARRNYLNGEQDKLIALAKYQYAAGNLLNVLQLKSLDMDPPKPETTPEEDMATTCPADVIEPPLLDKEAIFKKAQAKEELLKEPSIITDEAATPAMKPKAPTVVKPKK
ncbi:TolC family outer membrane protein [Azonexus sp.]|uniref:TolC family outer membrane protein n=1 Tax=Azonexus sp. TaxID=1872668 RepID=UPI0035AE3055